MGSYLKRGGDKYPLPTMTLGNTNSHLRSKILIIGCSVAPLLLMDGWMDGLTDGQTNRK